MCLWRRYVTKKINTPSLLGVRLNLDGASVRTYLHAKCHISELLCVPHFSISVSNIIIFLRLLMTIGVKTCIKKTVIGSKIYDNILLCSVFIIYDIL